MADKKISSFAAAGTPAATDIVAVVQAATPTINSKMTVVQLRQNPIEVGIPAGTAAAPSMFINGDTDTGIYQTAANELGIAANGGLVVNHVGVASGVNYAQFTNSALGANPQILWTGADAAVNGYYRVKGAAAHIFETRTNVTQFRVLDTASAVNYGTVTGSVTTSGVVFGAAGSDADISVNVTPKGAGVVRANNGLFVNGGASTYDTLTSVHAIKASTDVQYCGERTGTSTGKMYWGGGGNGFTIYNSSPQMVMRISTGGDVSLCANQGAESLRAVYVASAVNRVEITGATTTNAVSILAAGSDSNIDLRVGGKGTGLVDFRGGSSYTAGAWTATGYLSVKIGGTIYKLGTST